MRTLTVEHRSLNSRKLLVSRGIEIFDQGSPLGTNIIARANRLATAERWNVPQVGTMFPGSRAKLN